MIKSSMLVALGLVCAAAYAADPVPGAAPAAASPGTPAAQAARPGAPKSVEDAVRERVQARLGGTVVSVRRMPFGLFEVVADNEVVYVDETVNYLVAGRVFDTRTHEDLTSKRRDEVLRVDFQSLPLQLAVKTVRGDGSRLLAVFEDPNCPYCKKLEKDISALNNATIYTFLYPILSDDSYQKSQAIWCATDRAAAWNQLMVDGKDLGAVPAGCKHPLDDVLALGHKLSITGTPTLLFADGRRAPGLVTLDRIEQMMNDASHPGKP